MAVEYQFTLLQWVKIFIFIFGYLAIVFEHSIGVNKATSALLTAVVMWAVNFYDSVSLSESIVQLNEHLADISQVILFLIGALTIVEQINAHGGLTIVGRFLRCSSGLYRLFLVSCITFFMSSVLDNLTTTIVMIMLLRKCVPDADLRLIFGGVVVIAANAGGAWTPIGDVTTTMLWIGDKVSSSGIMSALFLPSLVCVTTSALILARYIPREMGQHKETGGQEPRARLVLVCGALSLVSVPLVKYITGLPPFMGILFAMGFMWLLTDIAHRRFPERHHLRITEILPRIDMPAVFFFLGILLAVGSLDAAGILEVWAHHLDAIFRSKEAVAFIIGLVSAVVDNIPLVAATMGMYDISLYPTDNPFWSLIAYCAGTGGSILVIGSAAGVAFMGLEKVDFFWYTKRIAPAAFLGYVAGFLVWLAQQAITF